MCMQYALCIITLNYIAKSEALIYEMLPNVCANMVSIFATQMNCIKHHEHERSHDEYTYCYANNSPVKEAVKMY